MIQLATIQPFKNEYMQEILSYQKDLYNLNFKDPGVEPAPIDVTALYTNRKDKAFVLLDNNKVIGFYVYLTIRSEVVLAQIYIVQDYRNKGFGKMLMKHFEEQVLKLGINQYELEASCMNNHAIEFYKKLNCNVDEEFESLGEKRYVMSKQIK